METRLDFKCNLIPRPFWRQFAVTLFSRLSQLMVLCHQLKLDLLPMKQYLMLAPVLLRHVAVRISLID